MSLFSAIQAVFGSSFNISNENASEFFRSGFGRGGAKSVSGVSVNEYLALNLPVVYSCVSLLSDSLSMLPINVQEYDDRSFTNITDHPIASILGNKPNPAMNPFTYRQTATVTQLLWGNHYSQIVLNSRGEAIGVLPLSSDNTQPFINDDGQLKYRTTIGKDRMELHSDEILHIKSMSTDGILGLSPISVARQAVGLGLAMETFGAKLFANDLRAGGFIKHPQQLSPVAHRNILESFQQNGGLENAWKVKLLEEGMDYVQASIPPEDAQFLGSREFQIAEIARIYRVPLVLLQSKEGGTTWGTGIEQLMIAYARWTILPLATQWMQELTAKMLGNEQTRSGKRLRVKIDVQSLAQGDMTTRATYYKTMSEIGVLTPDQIRVFEGYNPRDGV